MATAPKEAGRVPDGTGLSSLRDEAAGASSPKASIPSRDEIQSVYDCIIASCEHSVHHSRGAAALRTIHALVDERDRLYGLAKANNQLAAMNGAHRDEWRTKAAMYADALDRLSTLTPGAANAADANDLHLTVRAIAETALANGLAS